MNTETSAFRSRSIRNAPRQSISLKRHEQLTKQRKVVYTIYDEDGVDRTPYPLNPEAYYGGKERQVMVTSACSVSSFNTQDSSKVGNKSKSRMKTELRQMDMHAELSYRGSMVESFIGSFIGGSGVLDAQTFNTDPNITLSDVVLEDPFDPSKIPKKCTIVLNETETFFVLDLPSSTVLKDSEEGAKVIEENEYYKFLTVGKGKNRKTISTGVQTVDCLKKSRNTDCNQTKYTNSYAFACNWEMYDTYENIRKPIGLKKQANPATGKPSKESTIVQAPEEKEMMEIVKTEQFQQAVCFMERILANNRFNEMQKTFRGAVPTQHHVGEGNAKYNLKLLWTYANDFTEDRAVSAMEWNPLNNDILAVAYGKYLYKDSGNGEVMLWNIKNPVQPERHYIFESPITALSFSKNNPNILAVGNYFGEIKLINVTNREINILAESSITEALSLDPVWQIHFFPKPSSESFDDFISTHDDGKVLLFKTTGSKYLKSQQIMRVPKAEGKLKGLEHLKLCTSGSIPIARNVGALIFCPDPKDETIYYIGTTDGVVHVCSTNYLNHHLDLFLAHEGPVTHIEFSPFCSKLLLTCGCDMYTRFWCVDGLAAPIYQACVTLNTPTRVSWSPTYSTVLAAIRSKNIYIWDAQKKKIQYQSLTINPKGCYNTNMMFSKDGRCLVVGDLGGNVHMFALEDMTIPSFFQENLLFTTITKNLIDNVDAVEKLKKGLKKTIVNYTDVVKEN